MYAIEGPGSTNGLRSTSKTTSTAVALVEGITITDLATFVEVEAKFGLACIKHGIPRGAYDQTHTHPSQVLPSVERELISAEDQADAGSLARTTGCPGNTTRGLQLLRPF